MRISELKKLWANKHDPQGRINITIFFLNIFLFICHIFLMIIYIIVNHTFMICVNIVSLLLYFLFIPNCYKNIDRYMGIAFLEIWLHLICGILSFGWTPCYQNWCFGIIVAYFLPAFSSNNKISKRRPFHYAFLVMFTYFFLATFVPVVHLSFTTELDIYMNSALFIVNNTFVFVAITLFALFYTSRSNRKQKELSKQAEYDELTDLYNRYAINQLGSKLIEETKQNNQSYNIAILDIDFFKKVNDVYGHNSGDIILKIIGKILKSYSAKDIISGRWGGEEFVLLAPSTVSYSDFLDTMKKINIKVAKSKFKIENDQEIELTVSIGSASIKPDIDLESAVAIADERLYKAKNTGRNKVIG